MPTLYLIRGTSGSGKSFLAMALGSFDDAVHLEADDYFYDNYGQYIFDQDKLAKAHNSCFSLTLAAMQRRDNVVVANTFTRDWELKPYILLAKEQNYNIEIISVESTFKSEHCDELTVEKQRKRFQWKSFL